MPQFTFLDYEDYAGEFEKAFTGGKPSFDMISRKIQYHNENTNENLTIIPGKDNTSIADYVWLPLRFIEPDEEHLFGVVFIEWRDSWSLDEYI